MRNTKPEKRPCACCSVFHEASICAQCQVAGCAAKKKGEKCRLQGELVAVRELSEFQVRNELAELRTKYAQLLTESQRLARQNFEYEANWPKGLPRLDRGALDGAAGVDLAGSRDKSLFAGARQ